ncbi:MAG: glycine--tRNA ligase subunit beta [Gammaproteobacteria bacterium]|nr:glycine--tRNA ligase subunit beta [Gammaproteobacteria bacterium]MDH3412736.1 glycine--tRNA ligase subunit beta [Gammaproteobacteria bacterium]
MAESADLLVEIGTEELPPTGLKSLSEAFASELCERLKAKGLKHGEVAVFATPRRIATIISSVPASQPHREFKRRGPSLDAAFDSEGKPTKAAQGFARSCGVAVENLGRMETTEGSWLIFRSTEVGEATPSLIPRMVEDSLNRLPLPRRMRWANFDFEFIRPVHWVVLLFGNEIIDGEIFGVSAGRMTRGHRFHNPEAIPIEDPSTYSKTLYRSGHVVAEFKARAEIVTRQVVEAAASVEGKALVDRELIEETTALVEWPSAIVGSFDKEFLELPDAVLVATMKGHQRYFPVVNKKGALLPHFIAVSNIESKNPETVRKGNERVLRPRLKDAAYFFKRDSGRTLDQRQEELKGIVFQEKLGNMFDKAGRIARLASHVAIATGENPDNVKLARRAGQLCKCDLLTEMVGEFPELQGIMGGEYAAMSGESPKVAKAIAEVYRPRFAGDAIPASSIGRAVAVADKLDTLAGIFAIGQGPTGDKDPYALRRTALGVLRILIEGKLSVDLKRLIQEALKGYQGKFKNEAAADQLYDFMTERLRAYFTERGVPVEVFLAVQARNPTRPFDFAKRVDAVNEFRKLPEAESLASANKRINNILKQAEDAIPMKVDDSLFTEDAEWNLAAKLVGLSPRVNAMLNKGDYTSAMKSLAGLRENVDTFFDTVKVMDEDVRIRYNRLALLNSISELFLETADISRLS